MSYTLISDSADDEIFVPLSETETHEISWCGRQVEHFVNWKNDRDYGGRKQYIITRNILITLLVLGVLAAAACLAIHYTTGFDGFAAWAKELMNKSITVAQGLMYIAAPLAGGTLLITGLVMLVKHCQKPRRIEFEVL